MDDPLTLIGFRYSVYTRVVRMALIEMGLDAAYVEANPFAGERDPVLVQYTPFYRVPVLRHGDFTLTETAAITRYLDTLHRASNLIPTDAMAQARMMQIIGIIDAYSYQPLVRQVFSHGYYRPHFDETADPSQVTAGLEAAQPVLSALDVIADEGKQLFGAQISLADIYLAPMMDYFTKVPEGAALVQQYPALYRWWRAVSERPSLITTDPFAQT
ncbi:MAG: glutathione S-transferase family protein [Sulfitobacter sp.]